MPLLDVWAVLKNPAWLFFIVAMLIGGGGLALLLLVYPFAKDQ